MERVGMSIEPISALMKWFLPLLIKSDEDTYAEIARNAQALNPASVAVVMALWKVIAHRFSESAETHTFISNLYQQNPASDFAKNQFFAKLKEVYINDDRFATTLNYLYQCSERIDGYVQGYIQYRLPGDVSTDAPPPKKKKKPK